MFKTIARITLPVTGFAVGYAFFPQEWKKSSYLSSKITTFNTDVLDELSKTKEYERLSNDPNVIRSIQRDKMPAQHITNYVGTGLLFGPNLMEIDPVLFANHKEGEVTCFYHLGSKLISSDGQIHNGVVSTILDEGLCLCGFSSLPSKRGTTARLSIQFENQAPPNSTVVLRAKVKEVKGRKVVIDGYLETYPLDGSTPVRIANSQCILVEPRWFKYLSWIQIF